MRIGVMHPSFAVFGGTERLMFDLYPALVSRGHEVTLFTTSLSPRSAAENLPGVEVVDISSYGDFTDRQQFAQLAQIGGRLAPRLLECDVVRMHGMPSPIWWLRACEAEPRLRGVISNWCCHGIMGGLYDAYAAPHVLAARPPATARSIPSRMDRLRMLPRKFIERGPVWAAQRVLLQLHGGGARLLQDIKKEDADSVRNITTVVTDSRFVADYLRDLWGVDPVVCHPGLPERGGPGPVSPGDELLTVCRLQENKNVVSVLRAIALLKQRGPLPFSRYVIVGSGADTEHLRSLAGELGLLTDVVTFEGEIANDRLADYFDRAGLFILPALDESFGVTYLEAGSRARACIAPNHGGPSEIVVDGETGWVVEPTDIDAVAGAIQRAFADRAELERRGLAAKRRVETVFSMDRFVACTEAACSSPRV